MSPLPPGAKGGICRGCGAAIMWIRTVAGKNMPVNPTVDPEHGNVAVYRDGTGIFVGRTLTKDDEGPREFERLFVPHYATCSALHRAPKRPEGALPPGSVIPLSKGREVRIPRR